MFENSKFIFAAVMLTTVAIFTSCGNKSTDAKPVEDKNSVTINGTAYPIATIGSQVWTTVNYKGTGGYSLPATDIYGSYFTRSQANAITLPAGWRLPSTADYSKLISNYTTFQDSDGFYNIFTGESAPFCATSGWTSNKGTNTSGFNALPGGSYLANSKLYLTEQDALFVTSDFRAGTATEPAIYSVQISPTVAAIIQRQDPEAELLSVRFVKDK